MVRADGVPVVIRSILNVTADVKMRSQAVPFRRDALGPMLGKRQAQALIGQHQENEQQADESSAHAITAGLLGVSDRVSTRNL